MAWPEPSPIDLESAELDSSNPLSVGMVHCFAMALASSSGVRDFVTDEIATTTGTITTESTVAGDAYQATNAYGFTPASSVEDLTDQLTIVVIAKTEVFSPTGRFGHLISQHPAWFLTNQEFSIGEPTRIALEVGGVEYAVAFADGGEQADPDALHIYVATFDGTTIRTYQDGIFCNELGDITGTITGQEADNTRVGSYWGATDGLLIGARDIVLATLSRRPWSEVEIEDFSADPWQLFRTAGGGTTEVAADTDLRWTVLQAVAADVDLRWAVLQGVTAESDLRWSLLAEIGADVDLRWQVLRLIAADLELRWNNDGSVSTVTSDITLQWSIIELIARSLTLPWNRLAAVGSELDLRWSVLASVLNDLSMRWDVLAAVAAGATLQWSVVAATGHTLTLRWNVESDTRFPDITGTITIESATPIFTISSATPIITIH